MKRVVCVFLAAMFIFATFAAAQCFNSTKHGVVPVVTSGAGGAGSYWQTDVYISDAGGTPARGTNEVELWIWNEKMMRSESINLSLDPWCTVKITDVLSEFPGMAARTEGRFILNIDATYDVLASIRIYNMGTIPGEGDLTPGFGQVIPFYPADSGLSAGDLVRFPVPINSDVARVNVGIANKGWNEAVVWVDLYDDDGIHIVRSDDCGAYRCEEIHLAGQEVYQFQINRSIYGENGYVEIWVQTADRAGGTIYPYISVVDNIRTDALENCGMGDSFATSDPFLLFAFPSQ